MVDKSAQLETPTVAEVRIALTKVIPSVPTPAGRKAEFC